MSPARFEQLQRSRARLSWLQLLLRAERTRYAELQTEHLAACAQTEAELRARCCCPDCGDPLEAGQRGPCEGCQEERRREAEPEGPAELTYEPDLSQLQDRDALEAA